MQITVKPISFIELKHNIETLSGEMKLLKIVGIFCLLVIQPSLYFKCDTHTH